MPNEEELLPLQVKVCRSFFTAGLTLFNPNAFALDRGSVEAAAYRLALLLHSHHHLNRTLESERSEFLAHILANWDDYVGVARQRSGGVLAQADGVEYMSEFHQLLIQLKSFLDVFARMICRLLNPTCPPVNSFGEALVEGEKLSGGKLVKWLQHSSGLPLDRVRAVTAPIIRHSTEWITNAVRHRDTLSHYGAIEGFEHMRLLVSATSDRVAETDVMAPQMPGGEGIVEYSTGLGMKLGAFIEEMLSVLPVQHELIGTWQSATQELGDS